MKRARVLSVCIILFCLVEARATYYVSPQGTNEYPYRSWQTAAHSIQDAIDANMDEQPPDRVLVAPGRYEGNVAIPKGVRLRGAGPPSSTILAQPTCHHSGCYAVFVDRDAELAGFTVDGQGTSTAVSCDGGIVRDCLITGAGIGIDADDSYLDRCLVLHNGVGVRVSGVSVVYDTVVSACSTGVYGIGDEGYSLLVHCTITGNGGGVSNLDTMPVSMRDSIVWGNSEGDGAWEPVFSDITVPSYVGINGNISADPLFVGWGDFNDSDNPIYVDSSYEGEEDGTREHPFRMIGAALRAYDFHLSIGSPCIAAASDGLNMGAYPEDVPSGERSRSVLINVAPGAYNEGELMLHDETHLRAMQPCRATIVPPEYYTAVWMEGNSSIEGFSLAANLTAAIVCAPRSTPLISGCSFRPATEVGWDYPSMHSAIVAWGRDARPKVSRCLIAGFEQGVWAGGVVEGCTLVNNATAVLGPDDGEPPEIRNSIIWSAAPNRASALVNVPPSNISYCLVSDPSLDGVNGNIFADPRFVDSDSGEFRLRPDSPCIDAGFNHPDLPETDIVGMHRIMFGGKSLTVDMGAYEYYINGLAPGRAADESTLTWSSLADKTYSIFYTDDLLTWHLADENVPSQGYQTSSWTDDGSKTGVPPSLAPRRFYRILENP